MQWYNCEEPNDNIQIVEVIVLLYELEKFLHQRKWPGVRGNSNRRAFIFCSVGGVAGSVVVRKQMHCPL
jgi:CO dehydrogenase/acetyl-CoA synthase epsilon subunit